MDNATQGNEMYAEVEMTELEELECIYCELHKDVYGVKARWYRAESVEQARKDVDSLQAHGEAVWAEEKVREEAAVKAVELRIVELVEMGAGDRETAVRWLHDAEGTRGDADELCYALGVPYRYFK